MELRQFQMAVGLWQAAVFPDRTDPHAKACKVAEEAGEVAGAVVKHFEDNPRKTKRDIADEIGDTVIALAGLCTLLHLDLELCVADRWAEVGERTYATRDPRIVAVEDPDADPATAAFNRADPHCEVCDGIGIVYASGCTPCLCVGRTA